LHQKDSRIIDGAQNTSSISLYIFLKLLLDLSNRLAILDGFFAKNMPK
jgi:hypothetical protein